MALPEPFAVAADVQAGFEKPIPAPFLDIVTVFLRRASTRLCVKVSGLAEAYAEADEESILREFVKDIVVDAAERKIRNPGGFSHENAGIFSVSRYEDFAKGRITFDPEDLADLEDMLDEERGRLAVGPIRTSVPGWNRPQR